MARPGRCLGIDPGQVRVGVAVSDPDRLIATPLTTLQRDRQHHSDLDRIAGLIDEYEIVEIVVGMPRSLSGTDGRAAALAEEYAAAIEARCPQLPVHRHDERFSTVSASAALRAAGKDSRRQRTVIDQAAATLILQSWLDRWQAS